METLYRHSRFMVAVVLACILSSCAQGRMKGAPEASARLEPGNWGVDLAGMDTKVRPGDDFYRYVNGTWHDKAGIPADKTAVGPATSLQDLALDQLKELLDEIAADGDAPKGSDRQKIGDFYATLLDEERLVSVGLTSLQPDLDRIRSIADPAALADQLADNLGDIGGSPLGIGFEFDRAQVDKALVAIGTHGMSIPVREIYVNPEYEPVRTLYRGHLARVFELAGMDSAEQRAARVLELETRIAEFTWPLAEQRDPRKKFNPTAAAELGSIAPGLDWARFLKRAGVGSPEVVDVTTRSSIVGMANLIGEAPLEQWKDYLRYRLFFNVQSALPRPFRDEFFAFYDKTLGGQAEPKPRWKQALFALGGAGMPLSDPLGRIFIERYVPADARPQARDMVSNILKAFDARLAKLAWMTPETRAAAREKLSKTTIKLIYPDLWQETAGLEIVRGDAIGNFRRMAAFLRQNRDLDYLTRLPDRRIFFKPVYEVNAYANPVWNEIVFLAGIVRPPFFNHTAEPVVNYGAMGQVIGHEISHLFDDQGRLSDGDGLLRDWWKKEDAEKFEAVAVRLAEQISGYEPLPGKHVNGKLTLGESLADVAGLMVAYDAYRLSLKGKELPVVDGFTGDQRFFLAYAQAWRWKPRDAYLDQLLKRDVHPPSNVRPQTVRNLDAWYAAFNVQPGDKLYLAPEERVAPW